MRVEKLKPSRNQPCPCGSGKKFKRCHGSLEDISGGNPYSHPIPEEVLQKIAEHAVKEKIHKERHGDVREIITAQLGEVRIVATGKNLSYSDKWKVFTDFLGDYLHGLLGAEWGERQVKLSFENQHPMVQWRTLLAHASQAASRDAKGLIMMDSGAANSWFRLAYDLYLIEHNADLQRKLLKRLRDSVSFQGARFEAAVAAMMLASGYELRYAEEKGPGKHPEFYATHRQTGQVLAVEAKSRHRAGILGFRPAEAIMMPNSFDIHGLLHDALEKNTNEPLLIFVDVNSPLRADLNSPEIISKELTDAWNRAQEKEWDGGFPAVGVVFYNDAAPWYLSESIPNDATATVWAFVMQPSASRHSFDASHLLSRIAEGCLQRSTIPLEFPQE